MEEHGYKDIDERLKVHYLIAGIKYSSLNSIKTQILDYAPYRQDFDVIVTLYKDYIRKAHDTNVELNISGVGNKYSESLGKGSLTGNIEDQYYNTAVYSKFLKRHSEEYADLRNKCKQKAGNGGGSGSTSQISKLKRKVANQKSHIEALHAKSKGGGGESSDSDSDGEEEGTSNRGHPTLRRQEKKKKKLQSS